MELSVMFFYAVLASFIFMALRSKPCITGHNFLDRGKYFVCDKCGAAIIKKTNR